MSVATALTFTKLQGLGNDFVLLDWRAKTDEAATQDLTLPLLKHLGNRREGVGCDQILVVTSSEKADAKMLIYNQDASMAEQCGNGIRCVAHFLYEKGEVETPLEIETNSRISRIDRLSEGIYRVDMGLPAFDWQDIPLARACDTASLPLLDDEEGIMGSQGVNIGNPHSVFFVEDVEGIALSTTGPKIETDPLFPEGTNVEFASIRDSHNIDMRVWERGVGITLACGSGACATGVAAIKGGLAQSPVRVHFKEGFLTIEWAGLGHPVFMAGPATVSFTGQIQT